MSRPFVLCADDFGLTRGIDDTIIALAANRRLSAVSCMVTAPAWRADAHALAALGRSIELGVHLTFTNMPFLTALAARAFRGRPSRGATQLMTALVTSRLSRRDLRLEIERQIEAFERHIGRLPDYVDGHQHIHQFPLVRAAMIEAMTGVSSGWRPWLRTCAEPLGRIWARRHGLLDAASASVLGLGLRRKAHAAGIATNDGISGFYDVRRAQSYAAIFPAFLRAMGPRHLVVCHPGRCADDAERRRPWMACREHEYAFLAGPEFPALCAREGVRVATFAEIAGGAR